VISVQKLLQDLVGIPSVSSQSNRRLVEWIQRFFEQLGWHQRLLCYLDAAGIEKLNLIVSPQEISAGRVDVELAIVCHTDTVPFSPDWVDAIDLREQDGVLRGCGACDVKGFLACMLAAVSGMDVMRLRQRLCLVFTSDEEVGCRGVRFLLEQQALRVRYAIVGEPTSLIPARAGKGYCLAKVGVKGRAAHSAYPEAGRSAIFAATHLLREIEVLAQKLKGSRNEAFSPPWTTLNVGEIHGGTAKNIIPAECYFLLEWRPIPGQKPEFVLNHLRALIARLFEEAKDKCEIEVEVLRMEEGFETSGESSIIHAVQMSLDTPAQTIAFGTEAPWMAKMGAEVVVIGPGSMLTAHSPSECVPIMELDGCVHLLRTAIDRICG